MKANESATLQIREEVTNVVGDRRFGLAVGRRHDVGDSTHGPPRGQRSPDRFGDVRQLDHVLTDGEHDRAGKVPDPDVSYRATTSSNVDG